ncbi:MAG: hypothetical protein AAF623_09800 [Planctomycetota bacterium]
MIIHKQDQEGSFFRKIAEQGHYAGRTIPTSTRQGLYIATAGGNLLSSRNTTQAKQVTGLIGRGLAAWEKINPDQIRAFGVELDADPNYTVQFPEGGMILRETMRDLPREDQVRFETWRHNFDHVWLTRDEVNAFIPEALEPDFQYSVRESVVRKLARFHFVDQVKGEATPYRDSQVKNAVLNAKVEKELKGGRWFVSLNGTAACSVPPSGEKNPYSGQKIRKPRSVDLEIRGRLIFDPESRSFTRFDLLAFGDREGTATYNFRFDDMGPVPIGFAFELLPNRPENRIRPKFAGSRYQSASERQ